MQKYLNYGLRYITNESIWPKHGRCHLEVSKYLIISQILLGIGMGVGIALFVSVSAARDALAGSFTYLISTVYYAKKLFKPMDPRVMKTAWWNVCKSEAKKLLIFFSLCLIYFNQVQLNVWAFFIGLVVAQSAFIWAPLYHQLDHWWIRKNTKVK